MAGIVEAMATTTPAPDGSQDRTVMWFRRDLRLGDNPALLDACASAGVLPLFVLDPALWGPAGPSRRAYLAASLRALDASLRQRRTGLSVVRGDPVRTSAMPCSPNASSTSRSRRWP